MWEKKNLLFVLGLILIAYTAFSPALSAGFVDWDDPAYLLENPLLQQPFGWGTIKAIFTSGVNDSYCPLSVVTLAMEKHFVSPVPEASPFVFHFNNVLLHIINTILVFTLMMRLGIKAPAAFIGALLFGIHPMRVESVAWVTERKDVLYTCFYFWALHCYLSYIASGRKTWPAATAALGLLSCLSKIQGVTLPLSMMAIDYYTGRQWLANKIAVQEKLAIWTIALAVGIGNLIFLAAGNDLKPMADSAHYTFAARLAVGAWTYVVYLAKFIVPYEMTYRYEYPVQMPMFTYVLIVLVPLALGAGLYFAHKRGLHWLTFGLIFFTVNVAPMLQVLPVGHGYLADRFTYVGYFGLFFIIAKLADAAANKYPDHKKGLYSAEGVYALLLIISTYTQAATWTNTTTLNEHFVSKNPQSALGHLRLGKYYFSKAFPAGDSKQLGLLMTAREYMVKANVSDSAAGRKIPETSSDILQSIGVIDGLTGRPESAIHYFSAAIALTPNDVEALKNRGYQYFLNKNPQAAITDYSSAINISPSNSELYYLRANCFYASGQNEAARKDLEKAIELGSKDPNCFIAMAVLYRAEGDTARTREFARKAQAAGGTVPPGFLE